MNDSIDPDVEAARARLIVFQGRYTEICERFPAIGLSWLSKFANGARGKNPSARTMKNLKAALDQLELEEINTEHAAN